MAEYSERILIVGVSTRAMVESAVRAGYAVTAVDAFGDRDQVALAPVVSLQRGLGAPFSAERAVAVSHSITATSVCYGSGFENHPAQVRRLTHGRRLLGNTPETLVRVRDPLLVAKTLRARGFTVPRVRATAPKEEPNLSWLLKRRASGGGQGIEPWTPDRAVARRQYLQERIAGVPGSVVFVSDGRHAIPFGISRQLVGDRRFGARGFRYTGNILASLGDPQLPEGTALREGAGALAQALTESFGLVGVNGLDFMVRKGVPVPLEVNPRPTASMELAERAYGVSVFDIHVKAFRGSLPAFDLSTAWRSHRAIGKAVVYARRTVTMGNTDRWLGDDGLRDVPHQGERILRGGPICTILATGRNAIECYERLVRRAEEIYRMVEAGRRHAA